jgi:hypothetical protein
LGSGWLRASLEAFGLSGGLLLSQTGFFMRRPIVAGLGLFAFSVLLVGCTTVRATSPMRTATEQLLISTETWPMP